MGWKVTQYDEKKINHVFPEDEIHIMGYIIIVKDDEISSFCPCHPIIENHPHGGRTIVHCSHDGREYIEQVQKIINDDKSGR